MIDTSQTMKIKRSIPKLIGLAAIGLAFVAIGVWMIQGGAVEKRGGFSILFGWIGSILFGFCTLIALSRIIFGNPIALVLTPNGLRDTRLGPALIPWSAFVGLSVWTHKSTSFVCLEMQPEEYKALKRSRAGRIIHSFNRLFPIKKNHISITSNDLQISFADLKAAIEAYALAHNDAIRANK